MNGIPSHRIQQSKNSTVMGLSVLQKMLFINLKAQLLDLVSQCHIFMKCLPLMQMLTICLVTEVLEFLAKKKLDKMLVTLVEITMQIIKISSKPRVLD